MGPRAPHAASGLKSASQRQMATRSTNRKLDDPQIHQIARALADPRRLDLLRRISRSGDASCESLRCDCPVTAATISHHMKELESAGLVESMRDGRSVRYSLRRDVLDAYLAAMASI